MSLILDGTAGISGVATLSTTGGVTYPSWTTATRPAAPTTGQTGYNTTLGGLELYNGTAWTMLTGGPAFLAHLQTSTQSLTGGANTTIILTTKVYDTATAFNNTAAPVTLNGLTVPAYAFCPPVPGYYLLQGMVQLASVSLGVNVMDFTKNNALNVNTAGLRSGPLVAAQGISGSSVVFLNGTGDYVWMTCYVATTIALMSQVGANWFSATLIRGV